MRIAKKKKRRNTYEPGSGGIGTKKQIKTAAKGVLKCGCFTRGTHAQNGAGGAPGDAATTGRPVAFETALSIADDIYLTGRRFSLIR